MKDSIFVTKSTRRYLAQRVSITVHSSDTCSAGLSNYGNHTDRESRNTGLVKLDLSTVPAAVDVKACKACCINHHITVPVPNYTKLPAEVVCYHCDKPYWPGFGKGNINCLECNHPDEQYATAYYDREIIKIDNQIAYNDYKIALGGGFSYDQEQDKRTTAIPALKKDTARLQRRRSEQVNQLNLI
jgi:hypothetical protein